MPKLPLLSLCLFLCTSIMSCVSVGPDYTAPTLATPTAWNNLDQHELAHSGQTNVGQWWQGFDDPLLSKLIDQALANNLDLRSAETSLRQARTRRVVATAGLFPSLNAAGSVRGSQVSLPGGGDRKSVV